MIGVGGQPAGGDRTSTDAPVPFKDGKLLDFFRHFDPSRPQHVEGVRRLERSILKVAPQLLTAAAYWVLAWRLQEDAEAVPFSDGKLLDFFRYFNPTLPHHVEAIRRLERSLHQLLPSVLTDAAYWVLAWRTPPKAVEVEPREFSVGSQARIKIFGQHRGDSCGQASCAMAINALQGKSLDDNSFDDAYGYKLMTGLRAQCPNWIWTDAGDVGPDNWDELEASLRAGGLAVCAGNGPLFSPSGRGHIVLVYKLTDTTVFFADPNGGRFRSVTRKQWEQAKKHPDGNFIFAAMPR